MDLILFFRILAFLIFAAVMVFALVDDIKRGEK